MLSSPQVYLLQYLGINILKKYFEYFDDIQMILMIPRFGNHYQEISYCSSNVSTFVEVSEGGVITLFLHASMCIS